MKKIDKKNDNFHLKLTKCLKWSLAVDGILRFLGLASFTLFIVAVYGISGSTLNIGFISLATFAPSMIVMFFSGRIFNKFNSKNILIFFGILRLLTYLFAAIFHDQILVLYLAAAFHSFIHQISIVAKMNIDSNLVDNQTRINFLSLKNLITNVVIVVGPPLGGGLFAWKGATKTFLFMGFITFIFEITVLLFNKSDSSFDKKNKSNFISDFDQGNKHRFFNSLKELKEKPKTFLTVFTYCLVAIILEIQTPLIFPFVKEVYNKGPEFASYLLGLTGLGGIIGALLPKFFPRQITTNSMPLLMIIDGMVFSIFTLLKIPSIAFHLFAFLGLLGAITLIIVEAIVQIEVESEFRAQVYSIMQFAGGAGGASIGVLTSYLAEIFGSQKVLTGAAGIEILCGIFSATFFISLFKKNKTI
jgi:predicted MFS family arabinose efflux permease